MIKYLPYLGVAAAIIVIGVLMYFVQEREAPASDATVTVATSTYTLSHFVEQVGGDKVSLIDLGSSGMSPHDFEPTPRDIARIYEADLFIYHGAELDPWAERVATEARDKGLAVLEITESFDLLSAKAIDSASEHDQEEEIDERAEEVKEHEEDHDHGVWDPHIWVDPMLAIKEVKLIRDQLIAIDPANEARYNSNAADYTADLEELNRQFTTGLAQCQKRDIIVSHNAFSYLGERYNFQIHSIAGISPDQEPSAKRLGELTELAQELAIKYIFFETLVSPKLSETIANEVGAETLVLNPIGALTEENIEAGDSYISIMKDNLQSLQTAMGCTTVTSAEEVEASNSAGEAAADDALQINKPQPFEPIASPLTVIGQARGPWFFEGSFTVHLVDAQGLEIAEGRAISQGDWMTEDFVPFSARLEFAQPETPTGTLVFSNANPSGLADNEQTERVPVTFIEKENHAHDDGHEHEAEM